jgi:hypothetical protein
MLSHEVSWSGIIAVGLRPVSVDGWRDARIRHLLDTAESLGLTLGRGKGIFIIRLLAKRAISHGLLSYFEEGKEC